MEIRLGTTVILNEKTINTPFKCACSGSVNTKPLNSNEPRSNQIQDGVLGCTLTISFSVPFERGEIIEAIEDLRQANQDVNISSDDHFEGSIKHRKVRTVRITRFTTTESTGPNDKETPCVLVLIQKNSPDENALNDAEENLSLTPSDPATGFTIAQTIAYHSEKQKETKGLFLA